MTDLAERVARLEHEVAAIKIVFRTATGFDANLAEDTELLRGLVEEFPGSSQTGVCCAARSRFSFSRAKTIEVLRAGVGRFWRVEGGLFNSLLYFPIVNGTQANNEEKQHAMQHQQFRSAL